MRVVRIFALLSALAPFATSAPAQAQEIRVVGVPLVTGAPINFHRLSWPSTPVMAQRMVQDGHGFLWLSAADGLRRYDGYGLTRVPDSQNSKSIGFILGQSLTSDRSGRIWIGAHDSLNLYDPVMGTFKQFRSPNEACGTVAIAHDINEDQDGLIWLATDDGITALDPVTSKTTCYRPRNTPSLGETRVIATLPSRDGTLWITSSEGLYTLDRRSGKVTRHKRLETSSGRKFVFTGFPAKPFQDGTGTMWVGLLSGGDLASIDLASGDISVYSFQGAGLAPNASSSVVSIQEDEDGALWLGTNNLGLVKLTPDRKQAIWYQSNPDDPNGLGGDLVVGLFRDREGSFWATTKGGGVYRFQPQRPVFRSYRHERGNPQSLDEGVVTAAHVKDHDTLWIGTDRGLNRVDRRTEQVTRYNEPFFRRGVSAIAKDARGDLWFGTNGNGLVRFDPRSGRYRVYAHVPSDPRSLSYDRVAALWIDRSGTLWVATDFGLNRFDSATDEFRRYSPQPGSLTQYRSIAEEASGVLWLATSWHGLHRFDPVTSTFTIFENGLGAPHSPGHNRVSSVHVDRSGTVWAATFRGLDKYTPRDGTFKSYDSGSGLPTDTVLGILEDDNGYLWVSTLDGLSRFDPRAGTFSNYHTSDGLLTDLFNVPVVATKSLSGEMFFGSHLGVVAFFPDQVVEQSFVVPVVLTDFRLFGEPVQPGQGPLKQPIWSAASLELESRSIVSFDFSGLNYVDPARTRYRYRLEGLEPKWNETDSSRRTATYTTLPTGNYTLRVQARAIRGDWTESRVALQIRVLPPWYATWQFRSLSAAVLLTILWLAYQLRVRHLHHQFEMTVDARVGERTRIARDLHDTLLQSLHGVLLRLHTVSQLFENRPAAAQQMLDNTVTQVADAIAEGRHAVQGLRDSTLESNDLATAISTLAGELTTDSTNQRPAFHVAVEGKPRSLYPILRDEVYKIAAEALRNAFRHSCARSVEVQIRYDDAQFLLHIRDDGRGIDPALLSMQAREGHYGLSGMRERATLAGGQLAVWSEIGVGTEIELRVPANHAYSTDQRRSWLSRMAKR